MTPEVFKAAVDLLKQSYGDDPEYLHAHTDKLMEELLIELGYRDGVDAIRALTRWYA